MLTINFATGLLPVAARGAPGARAVVNVGEEGLEAVEAVRAHFGRVHRTDVLGEDVLLHLIAGFARATVSSFGP